MTKRDRAFVKLVYAYAQTHGRPELPWRKTTDPYCILVSEIMLQQTQVSRVVLKYREFLKQFPTVEHLSKASLAEVLRQWQGLGYNRRAKYLHACAQAVVRQHKGVFPRDYQSLRSLPGVGPYTAGAVLAFAYNTAHPIIETNIRTVYLHHYASRQHNVSDTQLLQHIERTVDREHPRAWYAALMDYGASLKQLHGNANVRSKHHLRQPPFRGSDRQLRGLLLRTISSGPQTLASIHVAARPFIPTRVATQLQKLCDEGMIVQRRGCYVLPGPSSVYR